MRLVNNRTALTSSDAVPGGGLNWIKGQIRGVGIGLGKPVEKGGKKGYKGQGENGETHTPLGLKGLSLVPLAP